MRIITVVISLLIVNYVSAQDHADQVDFSVLVVPTSRSTLEFYQLGFHHKLSDRISLGGSVNSWKAESKIEILSFQDTELSAGVKWHLFPKKSVFIDPNIHTVYHTALVWPDARVVRGIGLRGGVNAGYDFNQFGIGAMWQSSVFFGRDSYVGSIEPKSNVRFLWDFFDYGLYLSFKF